VVGLASLGSKRAANAWTRLSPAVIAGQEAASWSRRSCCPTVSLSGLLRGRRGGKAG
jgi:hypothetical protein